MNANFLLLFLETGALATVSLSCCYMPVSKDSHLLNLSSQELTSQELSGTVVFGVVNFIMF